VVHDYRVIKGDADFEMALARAAATTHEGRAVHRNPDVCMDNVLLLLVTAQDRVRRGEDMSAHGFVAMAADMIMALSRRQDGITDGADLLDPRRRIERLNPDLARAMHASVFVAPRLGIGQLVQYISEQCRPSLSVEQAEVLDSIR